MNRIGVVLVLLLVVFTSCKTDEVTPTNNVVAPDTYAFTRNGASSVSFGGQTTRILMATELASALKDPTKTEMQLDAMFDHQQGDANFDNAALNASSKSVRSKVAGSTDYFSGNSTSAAAIKEDFDEWISAQVSEVFPYWDNVATAGNAGGLQELGGKMRYMNAEGFEYDQAVSKSLIGALMMDQILNHYLSPDKLEAGTNLADNNNDVLLEGKNYTAMEHFWDEGYGYLYGTEANPAVPSEGSADNFLNKYLKRMVNNGFPNLPNEVFNAFKLGRAAINAKDYTVRDEQAEIIREKISLAMALRAVNYLQQAKPLLASDKAAAFHDLSEGVGFIYSLQFTRKPGTTSPYFSKAESEAFIAQLMVGDGFWDVTPATLETMSSAIAARFDFTVAQAAM